jgi:hypothetical protein
MAGTIIADFIRTDANRLSLQVGNTTFATINAMGLLSNTGTTIIAANGVISGAGTIAKTALPSGSILQVVSANVTATQISTTSTSFVTTNFSASITPTSATSKVYVVFMGENLNTTAGPYGMFTLYRNSTNLGGADGMVQNNNASAWLPFTISCVDSPATTSSTTYTIYQRTSSGANAVYVGWGAAAIHTFVLMEIAA